MGRKIVKKLKALVKHSDLSAADIVTESLRVAAEVDIYTNDNIIVEEIPCGNERRKK